MPFRGQDISKNVDCAGSLCVPGTSTNYFSVVCAFLANGDVIKWKHFPRYWPFVRGIHWSPMNSPHKGQWGGPVMCSLICAWTNGWVNNRDAGDLRRNHAHYDAIVMSRLIHEALPSWEDEPIDNKEISGLLTPRNWCIFCGVARLNWWVRITTLGSISRTIFYCNPNLLKISSCSHPSGRYKILRMARQLCGRSMRIVL